MELQKLIYTVEDGVAVVTMNYMKNLNAIDEQMADELMYVVDAAEKDPNVKVLVLKGTDRAFSAGGDIGYFYQLIQAGGEVNMDGLIGKVGIVADGLKRMSKMVITSVCGAAAGAGVSLALGGDFMICADNAKFILAFVNIGLVPDTGATYLLSKALGTARTMENRFPIPCPMTFAEARLKAKVVVEERKGIPSFWAARLPPMGS